MPLISDHFSWAEATITLQRDPKTGLLLPNTPDPQASGALVHTFQQMERVRALLGDRAITVHSAYRSPLVNAAVGGAKTSQHMKGEAVDFHVRGLAFVAVATRIAASPLPYDQLIEEGSWIHISFVSYRRPRRQALIMRVVNGRAAYVPFVPAGAAA